MCVGFLSAISMYIEVCRHHNLQPCPPTNIHTCSGYPYGPALTAMSPLKGASKAGCQPSPMDRYAIIIRCSNCETLTKLVQWTLALTYTVRNYKQTNKQTNQQTTEPFGNTPSCTHLHSEKLLRRAKAFVNLRCDDESRARDASVG